MHHLIVFFVLFYGQWFNKHSHPHSYDSISLGSSRLLEEDLLVQKYVYFSLYRY